MNHNRKRVNIGVSEDCEAADGTALVVHESPAISSPSPWCLARPSVNEIIHRFIQ